MRASSACIILLILSFAAPAFADFGGTVNFSNSGNRSTVTGIWAHTVYVCNATSECVPQGVGLACFLDYDNVSDYYSGDTAITTGSYGWCNASSITNCYHNNTAYSSGTNICVTNITTRSCSSGAWQGIANCSSGQTCASAFGTPGNCTASSSSSTSTGGGSTSTNATDKRSSIIFTSIPLDFSLVQGESMTRTVTVKNNGNATLFNVTLSSSLTWASISPAKWNTSAKNNETAFTVTFAAPADAPVKTYVVTLEVSTSNLSVKDSKTFNLNVKPSNATVHEQIVPEYAEYVSRLSVLEENMNVLQSQGADVEELTSLLLNAKSKLSQANESLEKKDYFQAKQLLDDAKGLLDAAAEKVNSTAIPTSSPLDIKVDPMFVVILAVVAGVVAFIIYMLLPPKQKKPAPMIGWEKEKKGLFKRRKGK